MKFPATYGAYTLLAELGEGGMAQVFLARKSGPGGFAKLHVIKRILPALGKEPEFVQMFLDEARLAARFEHPNVVQVYSLGDAEGSLYLEMEYLAGQSVAGLVREAVRQGVSVPPTFSARIVADACDGLHYVHDFREVDGTPLNIVHRDVSPQNLFVTYEGRVKLLDFGVAKAATTLTKTRTGSVKGKVSYMAPEQCRGEIVDRRADVFALGVVLTELIGGKRVFKHENEFALIRQLSLGEYPKPSEMGFASAPPELLAVCDRAMAFRREDRFATCAELKAQLDVWLATAPASGPAQVAALMGQLFKDDIALRQQVLMARDDSAEVFQKLPQETSGNKSLPSLGPLALEQRTATRKSVEIPQQGGVRVPWLVVAILVVILGAAISAALRYLPGSPPSQPIIIVESVKPTTVAPPALDASVVAEVAPPEPLPDPMPDRPAGKQPVKKPLLVKPKTATLTVKSTPSGCNVTVNGREQGVSPAAVTVEPSVAQAVVVQCAGYAVATKSATLQGGESATLELSLEPLGRGYLALKTSPWSVVFEGEKELGMTPLPKLELTAGTHTLRAVNKEQQLERTFTVTIKAGEVTAKTVDLKSEAPSSP
ncbi:MAG: serine/threonine protein kinase [Myxococcaceae bacterium]|nr:serine/threonine protein kinase [Myxococcaceae bacterium]